jgi:hypothetical protein
MYTSAVVNPLILHAIHASLLINSFTDLHTNTNRSVRAPSKRNKGQTRTSSTDIVFPGTGAYVGKTCTGFYKYDGNKYKKKYTSEIETQSKKWKMKINENKFANKFTFNLKKDHCPNITVNNKAMPSSDKIK